MSMIFFFILFNYTCLRNIKDSLIVTAGGSGAEALSYLKLFCVTPAAIIFMVMYAQASNIFSNEKLFYVTLTPFVLFFGAFAFFLYPNRDILHPSIESVQAWQVEFPRAKWLISIYGNWTYSIFYVLAEIWGSAILSLSFWQFANQITRTPEAKRFYAFFGLIAQTSLMLSGTIGEYFSSLKDRLPEGVDAWGISLKWQMGIVFVFGIFTMIIYRWIYTNVLTDKRFYDKPELPGVAKKKKKPSLVQSFMTIFTSPYLALIAILVITYGTSVNLIEAAWKSQVKIKYPRPDDMNVFMNQFSFWTGVVSMLMMIVGSNILRIFSWFTAAVVTPLIMFFGGCLFFAFVLFRTELADFIQQIGTNPVALAVMVGAVVVVAIKSTKCSLFDLTKEMAYIPLDEDMKVKGKAVVDVVGGRLGKSGGASIQAFLMSVAFPGASLLQLAPWVAGVFVIICLIWLIAVKGLSNKIVVLQKEEEKEISSH